MSVSQLEGAFCGGMVRADAEPELMGRGPPEPQSGTIIADFEVKKEIPVAMGSDRHFMVIPGQGIVYIEHPQQEPS